MLSTLWKMQMHVAAETGFAPLPEEEVQAFVDALNGFKIIIDMRLIIA